MPEQDKNLTAEQRRLLGAEQADELQANERWLAGKLGPPNAALPPAVLARLTAAVRADRAEVQADRSSRRRFWRWPAAGAAVAALLLGVLTLTVLLSGPDGDAGKTAALDTPDAPSVEVRAERAVDLFVATVNDDQMQLYYDLDRIGDEVDSADANPWQNLVDAIEPPDRQS